MSYQDKFLEEMEFRMRKQKESLKGYLWIAISCDVILFWSLMVFLLLGSYSISLLVFLLALGGNTILWFAWKSWQKSFDQLQEELDIYSAERN